MLPLVFVTQSEGKLREAEAILGYPLQIHALDLPEIQSIAVQEVVAAKAKYAYDLLQAPVMVDDTGLYIEAWGGLPGALVKWFLKSVGAAGICQMLDTFADRTAYAESIVGVYDGELHIYRGRVKGRIAPGPVGEIGFGWDPIFIPEGETRTYAEMPLEAKLKHSMRRLSFEALRDQYQPGRAKEG